MYLGVDIGTSTSKGVIVSETGRILSEASITHGVDRPNPGWAEHDPEEIWWGEFKELVSRLEDDISPGSLVDLKSIGISGMCSTFVPIGQSGRPLRPAILYGIDRRVEDELEEIRETVGEEHFREVTGSSLSSHSILPKIMWLRDNEPGNYEEMDFFLSTPGYIVYRLTGEPTMDLPTASGGAALLKSGTDSWAENLLEEFAIPESIFPELGWPADIAGEVTEEVSGETGLPQGIPVIFGTCDAGAEALSAGVNETGEALLAYGSTMSLLVCTDGPVNVDPFYGGFYVFRNHYKVGCATASAGNLLDWFLDSFNYRTGSASFYGLNRKAKDLRHGPGSIVTLPYFDGARGAKNDPMARGAILGLSLDNTEVEIYRSILEGIGFEVREIIDEVRKVDVDIEEIYAVGGGTRSNIWTRIISDITGKKQTVYSSPGAQMGAGMLAAIGVGGEDRDSILKNWLAEGEEIKPDPATRREYDTIFQLYKESYRGLIDTFHKLTQLRDG